MSEQKKDSSIPGYLKNALDYVNGLSSLEESHTYVYCLYHMYDAEPSNQYIKTHISPVVMDLLLAYLQFQTDDLHRDYGFTQLDAVEVLTELYGVEKVEATESYLKSFDLYINWEKWCGSAESVMDISLFYHPLLKNKLNGIVVSSM